MKRVLCHGVFDLQHIGHVDHLTEARSFGDYLIVSVVADALVHKPQRPMICPETVRMKHLRALRCVDEVILCEAEGPQEIIVSAHPDLYVRGPDYIGKRMPESDLLEAMGIPVRYTRAPASSTTQLIERIYYLCCSHEVP